MRKLFVMIAMLFIVVSLTACDENLDAFELLELSIEAQAEIYSMITETESQVDISMAYTTTYIPTSWRVEVESDERMRTDISTSVMGEHTHITTFLRDGYVYSERDDSFDEIQHSRVESDENALTMDDVFDARTITESMVEELSAPSTSDGYRLEFIFNIAGMMDYLELMEGRMYEDVLSLIEEELVEDFDMTMIMYIDENYHLTFAELVMRIELLVEGMDAEEIDVLIEMSITVTTIQIGDVTIDFPDWLDEMDADTDIASEVLIIVGNQELSDLLDSDRAFFLYVGRPTCPFCIEFKPILTETLTDRGESIYYFEVDMAMVEDSTHTLELLGILDITGVPMMAYIEGGEVIDLVGGIQSPEELTNFFERHQR